MTHIDTDITCKQHSLDDQSNSFQNCMTNKTQGKIVGL